MTAPLASGPEPLDAPPDVLATPPWLADLNEAQRAAVELVEGPLLILAGAGTGKTRVLSRRIAHLVLGHQVPAAQILAVTFTRKAAQEMRERVAHWLAPDDARAVTLTTFHALGSLIVREHGGTVGVSTKSTVADEIETLARVRSVLKTRARTRPGESERPRAVMDRIHLWKTAVAALVAGATAASLDRLVARYRAGDPSLAYGPTGPEAEPDPDATAFAKIVTAYQERLVADHVLDYTDLLVLPVLMLAERPDLAATLHARWRFLLVDEYQDTDAVQEQLLAQLAGPTRHLCVVGDDAQAIYSWRGAQVENIRRFADTYAPCQRIALTLNYRSSPVILAAANTFLAQRPEAGCPARMLHTPRTTGALVRLWTCLTQEAEAEYLVHDIVRARRDGSLPAFREALILYRKNALSRPIEAALRRASVPFRVLNGSALHERAHIRDVLAYAKVAVNPFDTVSFERAAGVPSRGLGPASLEALASQARAQGMSIAEAARTPDRWSALRPAARTGCRALMAVLDAMHHATEREGPAGALRVALAATGVRERLVAQLTMADQEDDDDAVRQWQRDLDDVDEFMLYIEEVVRTLTLAAAGARPALRDVLDVLATLTPTESLAAPHADTADAVRLMSVHAAKGLEAARVYVVGCEEGVFPAHAPPAPLPAPGQTTADHQQIVRAIQDTHVGEEVRLFYVALTRAVDSLVLSSCRTRALDRGEPTPLTRSRFLAGFPETVYRPESVR